LTAMRL